MFEVPAKVELLDACVGVCKLVKRSGTLDGSVPLRAAQACTPLLEGNAYGHQLVLEGALELKRGLGGGLSCVAGPVLDRLERAGRGALPPLVLQGFLKSAGHWESRLRAGAVISQRRRVSLWTGLLVQVPEGLCVRVAGTAEFAGFDLRIEPARIENLVRLAAQVYPQLADPARFTRTPWAGLRPVCMDGLPLIGPTRVPGLWLNTGHGHLGWTQAAGSGALLADLLTGQAPSVSAVPYAPQRFGL